MQKRASDIKKIYKTVFSPLPFGENCKIYTDNTSVNIPYAEDFPNLHYHDKYEIGICQEGSCLFLSDGNFYSVSKGDIVFILPNAQHFSRSLSENAPCKFRFVYLDADLLKITSIPAESFAENHKFIPVVLRKSEHPSSYRLLNEIINISVEDCTLSDSVALRLAIFITEAKKQFSVTVRPPLVPAAVRKRHTEAVRIAEFLSLNYHESHSAKELAQMCHLSESQLRRQFLNLYGIPPVAYRNRLRCKIAAELLCDINLSITEIAMQTGYYSASCFYRQFVGMYGISPSDYRNQNTV